jgi:hypothetical protein
VKVPRKPKAEQWKLHETPEDIKAENVRLSNMIGAVQEALYSKEPLSTGERLKRVEEALRGK